MPNKRKLSTEEKKRYIGLRRNFIKPVIGVTGYLGKTTTLEMLNTLLETRGAVLKNKYGYGSWGNTRFIGNVDTQSKTRFDKYCS